MVNIPGSQGHHKLMAHSKRFLELVNRFHKSVKYHDFSHLKLILSPHKRELIKKFLDTGDDSFLQKDEEIYCKVLNFFNHFKEKRREIGKTSFKVVLKQTAMLLGYEVEEFVTEILKKKTIQEFLIEKLEKSKPMYNCESDEGHEIFFLDSILCKPPNMCNYCLSSLTLGREISSQIKRESSMVTVDDKGSFTYYSTE